MTATDKPTGLALLRVPFPDHQISTLPKPTRKDAEKGKCNVCGGWHGLPAVHLDYVGHAALTDRLLDADPHWSWEPVAYGQDGLPLLDEDGGLWIRLTVCGVTRLGYGDSEGKRGPSAMKERIGDALRNAAMRFGAALDLWHKGELHLDDEEQPKEPVKVAETPKRRAAAPAPDPVPAAESDAAFRDPLFVQWLGKIRACSNLEALDAVGKEIAKVPEATRRFLKQPYGERQRLIRSMVQLSSEMEFAQREKNPLPDAAQSLVEARQIVTSVFSGDGRMDASDLERLLPGASGTPIAQMTAQQCELLLHNLTKGYQK